LIDAEIQQEKEKQKYRQSLVDDANKVLDESRIIYELPLEETPDKQSFFDTYHFLKKMLDGAAPINLERAIFETEKAYDQSLKFEAFDKQVNKSVEVIGLQMKKDKIQPNDNVGKIMTAFKFMTDTLSVYSKNNETRITTYPKTYDFEDFWGKADYRKMFVSKLMREGTGQCHSLPLYFLILCEKINAEASLAYAPNHSYIKFKDQQNRWHNIELTNGVLASNQYMMASGFIKSEAIQNKIYLQPLTKQHVIIQCLNDLALGYTRKYGYDSFVYSCTKLALQYDKNNLGAVQLGANYFATLDRFVRYQYKAKGLPIETFVHDERATSITNSAIGANKFIDNLGYSEIPADKYEEWLRSVKAEAYKQQHSNEVKVLGNMIQHK